MTPVGTKGTHSGRPTQTAHDWIHARKPTHDLDRWSVGTIQSITERDGHCVVTVSTEDGDTVELTVTLAIRDLFESRLDLDDGASPVGAQVWYREYGTANEQ